MRGIPCSLRRDYKTCSGFSSETQDQAWATVTSPGLHQVGSGPALSFLCRELRERYQVTFSLFFCLNPCTKHDGDHCLYSQTRETGVSLGWGFATVCLHITSPHHCFHRLSRQPALQPRTHHPFLLHLMASLYTYRPQTFGLVFVIASVPSGETKHTSPKYLYKAEVLKRDLWQHGGNQGKGQVLQPGCQRYLPGFACFKKWALENNTQKQCQEVRDPAAL